MKCRSYLLNNPVNCLQKLNPVGVAVCVLLLLVSGCTTDSTDQAKSSKVTSMMDVLPLFTAANVPAVGPEEIPIDPPNWTVSPDEGVGLPGEGLVRHPMLYIGEGCNKMFLINEGKVIWT